MTHLSLLMRSRQHTQLNDEPSHSDWEQFQTRNDGDLDQCDLEEENGLSEFLDLLNRYKHEQEIVQHVTLSEEDVMRSEVVKEILKIYKNGEDDHVVRHQHGNPP